MNKHQTALLDAAVRYHQLGFSMIPLIPNGKTPLIEWKGYQNQKASLAEIEQWVLNHPDMNLGLVTGSVSGIAVVDIEAGGSANGYPPTATAKTGRGGYHLFYSIPKGKTIPSRTRVRDITDIRGEGGYVVAAPSKTDDSYEWVVPITNVSELPPFPLELLEVEKNTDWRDIPLTGISEGSRNDSMTRFLGGLMARLNKSEFESVAWPVAKGLNSTFSPPLEEAELRSAFESIATREASSRTDEEEVPEFETFSLADLYQRDLPVKWLVRDLIPLDAITAITGDSSSFKSFITQALAVNVNTGEDFLGHFPVEAKGPVLIVDEENSHMLLKKRFKDLGVPETNDIRFLSFKGFRADSEKSLKRLKEVVDSLKPRLVVLDSLVDIHAKNENDGIDMAGIFNALRKNILTPESALVVIHHRRKTQAGYGGNVGQNIRGSTGIRGAIDAHLAVDRKGKNDIRITQDKLRVQEQLDPFLVSLVPTENGQVAFAFQGKDMEHQEAVNDLQKQIVEHFDQAEEEWIGAQELADSLGFNRPTIDQAAAGLLATGRLMRKAGARNKTLFALGSPEEEESSSDDSVS